MEPFSIASGCIGLINGVAMLLMKITTFVSEVRGSRKDMDAVVRELTSLQLCLGALKDDELMRGVNYPENIRSRIKQVIVNCEMTTQQMAELLLKLQSGRFGRRIQWSLTEKDGMNSLRSSLESNKTALEIVLTTGNLAMLVQQSKYLIKQDVQSGSISASVSEINAKLGALSIIQKDTAEIKYIGLEVAELRIQLAELARMSTSGQLQSLGMQLKDYAASLLEPIIIASGKSTEDVALIKDLSLDLTKGSRTGHSNTRRSRALPSKASVTACDVCQNGWIESHDGWAECPGCPGPKLSSAANATTVKAQECWSDAQARAEIAQLKQEVVALQTELHKKSGESSGRERALDDRERGLVKWEKAIKKMQGGLRKYDHSLPPSTNLSLLPKPVASYLHIRRLCAFGVKTAWNDQSGSHTNAYTFYGPLFRGYSEHDGYPISGLKSVLPVLRSYEDWPTHITNGPTEGAQLKREMLCCLRSRAGFAKFDTSPENLEFWYSTYNETKMTQVVDDRNLSLQSEDRGHTFVFLFMRPLNQDFTPPGVDYVDSFGKNATLWHQPDRESNFGRSICKTCTPSK